MNEYKFNSEDYPTIETWYSQKIKELQEDKQKLVDLCFEISLMLSTPGNNQDGSSYDLTKLNIKEKAEWIARQLRLSGFDTEPVGMSRGKLKDKK